MVFKTKKNHSLLVAVPTYTRRKNAFSWEVGTATRIIVKKRANREVLVNVKLDENMRNGQWVSG